MTSKTNPNVIIVAIFSLTILESVALFNGINGTLFTLIVGVIAGLAGWTLPSPTLR